MVESRFDDGESGVHNLHAQEALTIHDPNIYC